MVRNFSWVMFYQSNFKVHFKKKPSKLQHSRESMHDSREWNVINSRYCLKGGGVACPFMTILYQTLHILVQVIWEMLAGEELKNLWKCLISFLI